MNSSTRGAARVGIVWVIAAGVLGLVGMAFGFLANSDSGKYQADAAAAEQQRKSFEQSYQDGLAEVRQISEAVGWRDATVIGSKTDIEAVKASLASLRETFTDIGDDVKDIESALPLIVAAYNKQKDEITALKNDVKVAQGERDAAIASRGQVTSSKDREISTLRSSSADAADAAQSRIDDLEARVTQLTDQNSELDLEARRARQEVQDQARAHEQELARFRTRLASLGQSLTLPKSDTSAAADGSVLAVSDTLPIGWIDLGSRNRVVTGMRFDVKTGGTNSRFKCKAEITKVEPDTAQVAFSSLADRFDPVVPGDILINPLFDPTGERNAVLVGRFDAAYNEKELRLLLADIGINVQPKLDNTTHYLVVGSELWTDEDGEPLEEAVQPSELPVYREAEALGVQIVPLQHVREFFTVQRS